MSSLLIKTPNQILNDMLRTIKCGLIDAGIDNPQLDPGSDFYITCSALANEIAVAMNNVVAQGDNLMPDTATGTDLDRILNTYGLSRRGASVGSGNVILSSTLATLIPTGTQLVSSNGLLYEVTTGGIYNNGDEVPIQSIDSGSQVNLEIDSVLSWVSTPAFASNSAILSSAITGAVDAEDDETARQRLLNRFANPPSLSNWQQVAEICELSDNAIQKSFIYPCANGPSTIHIALSAYPTSTSVSRELSASKLTEVTSIITAQLPEYVETTITTVVDTDADLTFKLTVPYPQGASVSGTGGGWIDYNPFPSVPTSTGGYCYVSSMTNTKKFQITTYGTAAPVAGVSNISWIDKTNNFKVIKAKVLSFTLISGSNPNVYEVNTDYPFTGLAVGDYIFPALKNGQAYVDAVIKHFALMGPGEKTNVATILPRAYRKPRANNSYPNSMDGNLLKALFNSAAEIESCDYYYRSSTTAPSLPAYIYQAPLIYIPRNIGFYPSDI